MIRLKGRGMKSGILYKDIGSFDYEDIDLSELVRDPAGVYDWSYVKVICYFCLS